MIDPRVSIADLRVFLAVAETEHVTAAAAKVHLSQPAVTRAVGRLEHQLGARLFDRPGQRVRLNAIGRLMVGHAQQIVADFEAARADLSRLLDPDTGPLRLGFLGSLGTWLVPDVIRSFRQIAPAAELVLRQGTFDLVAELLRSGEIDLLLTSPRPRLRIPISWQPLGVERLELAVPPGHHLAARRRLRLAEAADEPFVVLGEATEFRSVSDRLCRRAGFTPKVVLETDEVATARALVAAGLGVAILPMPHHLNPAALPAPVITDPGAERLHGLAWITRRRLPGTARALLNWLLSLPDNALMTTP
jgi:LysR family transcriptional activator of glutamate synthase operon